MKPIQLLQIWRSFRAVVRGTWMYWFGKIGQQRIDGWQMLYSIRLHMLLRVPTMDRFIRSRSVRIWADTAGFNRIIRLLNRAKFSIAIQIFIWRDDESGRLIAESIVNAADRGVKVRIAKEAVGDMFEASEDFMSTKTSAREIWKRFWNHPNISIVYEANHDHAKVFIIDREYLLLTGMNIGDEYRWKWHDFVVELRGPHFIDEYLQAAPPQSQSMRLIMNRSGVKNIRPEITKLLNSARRSIFLEQSYVSDPEILEILLHKADQGIEIILILPQDTSLHHYANMLSADKLLKAPVKKRPRVYLFPKMIHGKVILVDLTKAFIGSTNLMTSSLDDMGEVSLLLDGEPQKVLRKIRDILMHDYLRSEPLEKLPFRPISRRILAWLKL